MDETYYTILGVSEKASAAEIKAAWRELIRQVHPDMVRETSPYVKKLAEEKAKEINEAYRVLSDPEKRRKYDQLLASYIRSTGTSHGSGAQGTGPHNASNASGGASKQQSGAANNSAPRSAGTTTPRARRPINAPAISVFGKPRPNLWASFCLVWGVYWFSLLSSASSLSSGLAAFVMAFLSFGWAAWIWARAVKWVLSKIGISTFRSQFFTTCAVITGPLLVAAAVAIQSASATSTESGVGAVEKFSREQTPLAITNTGQSGSGNLNRFAVANSPHSVAVNKNASRERQLTRQSRVDSAPKKLTVTTEDKSQQLTPVASTSSSVEVKQSALPIAESSDQPTRPTNEIDPIPSTTHPSSISELSPHERQSIESACSTAKYVQGPAEYKRCLSNQLLQLARAPRRPDLSQLSAPEQQSIESACSTAKFVQGPAEYNRCLSNQLLELARAPRRPDLSQLSVPERQSIESACSTAKFVQGPAEYNRCLSKQLRELQTMR